MRTDTTRYFSLWSESDSYQYFAFENGQFFLKCTEFYTLQYLRVFSNATYKYCHRYTYEYSAEIKFKNIFVSGLTKIYFDFLMSCNIRTEW